MRLLIVCGLILINLPSCSSPEAQNSLTSDSTIPEPSPSEPSDPPESPIVETPVSSVFLYRLDTDAAKIYRASIDSSTGEIAEHEATDLTAGSKPVSMTLSADKKYLFVGSFQANKIETFEIDQTTGELTLISSFSGNNLNVDKVYADPLNRYLWSLERYLNSGNEYTTIVTYEIKSDGTLEHKTKTNVSGDLGIDLVTDVNSKRLYLAIDTLGIRPFEIDSTTGKAKNPGTTYGAATNALVINSNTTRVYGSPAIYGDILPILRLDPATGDVLSSDYMRKTGQVPAFKDIALNASGDRMYLLSESPGVVRSYTFVTNPSEEVEQLNSVSLPNGCKAKVITNVDTAGYLFTGCTDSSGQTFSLKLESDGSLSLKHTSVRSGIKLNDIIAVAF